MQRVAQVDAALSTLAGDQGDGYDAPLRVDDEGSLWTRSSTFQYKDVNVAADDASVASAAVILTYTPASGKTATVIGASNFGAGTAEIDVVLVSASESADITVARWNAGQDDGQTAFLPLALALEAGDSVELEVTTVDAAETADVAIFAKEEV